MDRTVVIAIKKKMNSIHGVNPENNYCYSCVGILHLFYLACLSITTNSCCFAMVTTTIIVAALVLLRALQ